MIKMKQAIKDLNTNQKINISQYKQGNEGFICCNCSQYVHEDDCVSNRGHNLICTTCITKLGYILSLQHDEVISLIHCKGVNHA